MKIPKGSYAGVTFQGTFYIIFEASETDILYCVLMRNYADCKNFKTNLVCL